MFRKRDVLLGIGILLAAGILFLVTRIPVMGKVSGGMVRIRVNGQLYAEEKLGAERDVVVTQANGAENVVRLTKDGFYMARSTCKNQLCVQQGAVTEENYTRRALGNYVICLPNWVEVELVLENDGKTAADPDAPDI